MRSAADSPDRLPAKDITGDQHLCRPDCELCHGVGFLRYDVPYAHPLFGKLDLCPNVDRWNLPYARRFGITKQESDSLHWNSVLDVNGADAAVQRVQTLLNRGHGWLYLWGSHGLAKTLLLKIAVAQWIKRDHEGAYARMAEIIDHQRAAFDSETPSLASEERLQWWSNVPLLAIDEIERMRSTQFSLERQFLLLDRRYESAVAKETMTIMASNEAPSTLPSYLSDRIYDGRFEVFQLRGDSLRPGMDWSR